MSEKPRKIRYEGKAEKTLEALKKLYQYNYGDVCEPHDEECVKCSAYMVVKEFKRLYID